MVNGSIIAQSASRRGINGVNNGAMPYTVKGISIELVADWASATQHRTVSLGTIKVALSQKGADQK